MGWFSSKTEKLSKILADEKIYEIVAQEIAGGDIRQGLWAKAWSICNGDDIKAKSKYIQYRAEQLRLEYGAAQEIINSSMRHMKREQAEENHKPIVTDILNQTSADHCKFCGSKDIARRSGDNMPSWCFACKKSLE